MYNVLLDALPCDYQGYLIRTDFRIGIQISQVLEDESFTPQERLIIAYDLLYGEGVPPFDIALAGLQWFLNPQFQPEADDSSPAPAASGKNLEYFSFDYDAGRIYTGFLRAYRIHLDRERIHWFQFLHLLSDLGECAFTRVIDFRTADLSKMDKETKKVYQQMRRKFRIPKPNTPTPEENEFMALLNGEDA